MNKKIPKKLLSSIPSWLILMLLVALVASTATAFTILTLQNERINVWSSQIENTNFSITDLKTQFKGSGKIEIGITINNDDASNPHNADVTIQLLNSTGDVILEQTKSTGAVAAIGTWSSNFVFTKSGLVSEYDQSLIEIKQTS